MIFLIVNKAQGLTLKIGGLKKENKCLLLPNVRTASRMFVW